MKADARTVFITGGSGNLGSKLVMALETQAWAERIIVGDIVPPKTAPARAETLIADFSKPDGGWREAAEAADVIVHLASANPAPDSGWPEAATSFDMTSMLLAAAAGHACRFLFGSSNHVMGKYKDADLGPGELTTSLPPSPGTPLLIDGVVQHPQAYGATKLMAERALVVAAAAPGSKLTGVAIRVGWCQRGVNHPRTMHVSGQPHSESSRDLRWFRNMWLSDRDLTGTFIAAMTANSDNWPERAIVVNGVSNNHGTPWDLEPTRRWLGYHPVDDVWATLGDQSP